MKFRRSVCCPDAVFAVQLYSPSARATVYDTRAKIFGRPLKYLKFKPDQIFWCLHTSGINSTFIHLFVMRKTKYINICLHILQFMHYYAGSINKTCRSVSIGEYLLWRPFIRIIPSCLSRGISQGCRNIHFVQCTVLTLHSR